MREGLNADTMGHGADVTAAAILSRLILGSWATYVLVGLTGLYWGDWGLIRITAAGVILLAVPLWLLRRGHIGASNFVFALCVLGTVTAIATAGQGIHDLAILAYPIVVLFSSLTWQGNGFRLGVLLTLAAMGWLVFGEASGLFVSQPYETPTYVDFLVVAAVLMVGAYGVDLLATNMRKSLETARQEIEYRKRAEEALQETNAYLDNLINYANAPIIVWDAQFRITRFNHAAESLTGRSEAEVLGQSPEILFLPALATSSMDLIRKTTTGARWESIEIAIRHRDGSDRMVLWNSATLFAPDGQTPIATIAQGQDITQRKQLEEELQQQATTDGLTGTANRRHFLKLALSELTRALRLKRPLAIAMIDIDHLKTINDAYGHAIGDQTIVAFATVCRRNIREIDLLARIGGDEFALLFPETTREQALGVVERVRQALATMPVSANGLAGLPVSVTSSAGISSVSGDQETLDGLLRRADQALYRAKEAGRDRVVVESDAG